MAVTDLNDEWLGHVQPVGLVVASVVCWRGSTSSRANRPAPTASAAKRADLRANGGRARAARSLGVLRDDPRLARVAGRGRSRRPGTAADLSCRIEESDTESRRPGRSRTRRRLANSRAHRGTGVEPDARGAIEGWEATPHQRLERLLRETGVPIGLLITDEELRLVYAPRGETSGWITFPIRSLAKSAAGRCSAA